MCLYIYTHIYIYEEYVSYPGMCIYRDMPTYTHCSPFFSLLDYRPEQRRCSAEQITCVTPVTFSQADTYVKGKKGSVIKGAACPALPGCRRSSLPPVLETGG